MSKKIIPIDYTSSDFNTIKKALLDYTKRYYPNTYKDFNEVSFGSLMTDLVAYVGDNLSFYLDYNANESFLGTSLEYDNVIQHAKQLGYKHTQAKSSVGMVDIYIPIPADTVNVRPDTKYMPKIARGTTFSTVDGNVFTLIEDIETYDSTSQFVATEASSDGSRTTYYSMRVSGKVISGEERQALIEVGDFKRFMKIKVPSEDITDIVSVFDLDGNEYYEVDYLSQNVVYRPVLSNISQTSLIDSSTPSVMKPFPVPRRFVVDREGSDTYIVFGYGSESELKQNVVAHPSDVVMDIAGKNYVANASFDPSRLMSTDKFGVGPDNTTLTITYRTNTLDNVNVASRAINTVLFADLRFMNPQQLESAKIDYITSNISVVNTDPINGDIEIPTTEEIKRRTAANFAMQGRAVTLRDYIAAAYAMPPTFGSVTRAAIYRDEDDFRRNMNMYVVSQDSQGYLAPASSVLKQNLRTWIDSVRMINDSIDIFDARVINIGIDFTVLAHSDVNKAQILNDVKDEIFDKLNEAKPDIGEHFSTIQVLKAIREVEEVLDILNVRIVSKSSLDHTGLVYDIQANLVDSGRVLRIPFNCIWELKYKSDITGTIR